MSPMAQAKQAQAFSPKRVSTTPASLPRMVCAASRAASAAVCAEGAREKLMAAL